LAALGLHGLRSRIPTGCRAYYRRSDEALV
jgi:hypothetical protein